MSEQAIGITYGMLETKKSHQLVISGPREFMTKEHEDFKVGSSYPFKLFTPDNGALATWKLNAGAIGRMSRSESRNESLTRANSFINTVAQAVAVGAVPGDPNIRLLTYEPDEEVFRFAAEVKKPSLSAEASEAVVRSCTASMARDLELYPRGVEPTEHPLFDVEILSTGTSNNTSGIHVNLGRESVLRVVDTHDQTFEVQGRQVMGGVQPLVYLAAVVAAAHADILAKQ